MKGLIDFEPATYYHVINHAVGSENLFRTEGNYHYFLEKYAHYSSSVFSTIAYCLMPNHIHFLVKTHSEITLEAHPKYKLNFHKLVMQEISNLLNAYAKAYNIKYNRKGALWIDFTKRFKVDSESYLTSIINYIHQNPVKHGFIGSAEDWHFSSFNAIVSEKSTLLKREDVVQWFGGKENYLKFHLKETGSLNCDWEY